MADRVVVLGGGLAAVRVAETLREEGHQGEIVLVSEEHEAPYDRPPLSKNALEHGCDVAALELLPPETYAEDRIELLLGRRAVALDLDAHTVRLHTSHEIGYDRLVVATGSRPRRIPSVAERADVHVLRTVEDCRGLGAALRPGAAVAVVGAGFIGLEVAATAAARGCLVTVVEAASAPLVGVLGPQLSTWLVGWHAERGVRVRTGVTVASEGMGRDGRLVLDDGTSIDADAVVVGVGIVREVDWLAAAGLEVHVGLVCDPDGRTSHPDVFGAGDVVCRHDGTGCSPVGHWSAAADSAVRTGYVMAGQEPPAAPDDAFFWSHQGQLRLQSVGGWSPGATTTLVSGAFETGTFVAHHHTDGRLIGVLAANDPRGFLAGRRELSSLLAVAASA